MGPGSAGTSRENKKKKKIPKVEEFLQNRDFTGARTLLEVLLTVTVPDISS
jgi:intraflagellar transport protein 56